MDGIAELLENNRLVRGMGFASGLLWVASFAFYTIGPGIVERSEKRRAAARTSGIPAGKGRAMPGLILVLLIALVTALEGAAAYLGVPGELMFPIAVFTLVALIFTVGQAFQWATGTGEWAPRSEPGAMTFPAAAPSSQPKKKKKKRRRPRFDPLPAQEPPRHGALVQWFEGQFSRVRGEYYMDQDCSDHELIKLLRMYGLTVLSTFEAGNKGADDFFQLKFASSRRMVIITRDFGFERKHNAGVKHSGIIHAPHGPEWYQEILRVALRLSEEMAEA